MNGLIAYSKNASLINGFWFVVDTLIVLGAVILLCRFLSRLNRKAVINRKSLSRKWMINRIKRGVFKESPGYVVILGYKKPPEQHRYHEYDYSYEFFSDKMWTDALSAIIGHGEIEKAVQIERYDPLFRVLLVPCNKFTKPFFSWILKRWFPPKSE